MLQGELSAILSTFIIQLPFFIKIFVLSIFEKPIKTGFTVFQDFYTSLLRNQINLYFMHVQDSPYLCHMLRTISQNVSYVAVVIGISIIGPDEDSLCT